MATVAIYKATNILNGKMYIGQTTRPERRFAEHTWQGSKSKILSTAIKKHGKENFEFNIMCWCPDKAYADMVETKLIEAHDTRRVGYNICVGGEGFGSGEDHPTYGSSLSEEHKVKVSAALKGKKKSPEHIAKVAATWVGKKHTAEARQNMSKAHIGHTHTEATKTKMAQRMRGNTYCKGLKLSAERKQHISLAIKGTVRSEETRAKMANAKEIKGQVRIQRRGEVFVFENPSECAEYLETSRENVMRYLRGERKRRDGWAVLWVDKNGY